MPTSTGTIDFEPQLPFLLLGSIFIEAIEKAIREGLRRPAERYKKLVSEKT